MKNKEFYKDQLAEIAAQGSIVAKINNEIVACNTTHCQDCDWRDVPGDCVNKIKEWAEEEHVKLKYNPFEVQSGNIFYFVDYDGCVRWANFNNKSEYDKQAHKFGNACKDEEYMKKRAKEIHLYNLLSNFAYQVNEGWIPNWDDDLESKWFIWFNSRRVAWETIFITTIHSPVDVYFKTKELAQRAIDEIIIPFEKGKLNQD